MTAASRWIVSPVVSAPRRRRMQPLSAGQRWFESRNRAFRV